jgi:hypothetical protein
MTPLAEHARAALEDEQLAEWVVTTCLMFGATVATAYQVAGLFMQALDAEEKP